nr:PREDICTED: metal transporter CNNM4-like isoform X2 [Bemisia tabaci]
MAFSFSVRHVWEFLILTSLFNLSLTNDANSSPVLYGVSVEHSKKEVVYEPDSIRPTVEEGSQVTLALYGDNFHPNIDVGLNANSEKCNFLSDGLKRKVVRKSEHILEVSLELPHNANKQYFFCLTRADENKTWVLGSNETLASLAVRHTSFFELPLWATIATLIFCVIVSCILSGLNLGLMTLDRTDLLVLQNAGTDMEKRYAKKIMPVREKGNFLLCSILFALTCVNSVFTVVLDSLFVGWVAVIISTFVIVLFCEILPQAICARHGLKIGYSTIYLTIFTMGLTSPLSWPIGRILDIVLGKEIGSNVSSRERLKELIRVTSEFTKIEKEEINIIHGALEFGNKKVEDIMTYLDDVYMMSAETLLDYQTISGIVRSGYSRVPIYQDDRTHVIGVLMAKDLAVLDPDDNIPVKNILQCHHHELSFVPVGTKLDVMLKMFKTGMKGHMAFVYTKDLGSYKAVDGLVTLEDVIEELIQAEINDETDVYTDNRSRRKCVRRKILQDLENFAVSKGRSVEISPHLRTAAFQYLITEVEPFKPKYVSSQALNRLLRFDIYHHIAGHSIDGQNRPPSVQLYTEGKSADYFIMILQGKVMVKVGIENLTFQSGPFAYFGIQALMKGSLQALPMANSSPVNRLLQDAFSHFFPDPGPNDLDLPPPSIPRQSPFHSREGSTHDGGVLEEGELSSESAAILLEAVRLEIKQDNLEQAQHASNALMEAEREHTALNAGAVKQPGPEPQESVGASPQNSSKSQGSVTSASFTPYYTVSTHGEVYYMRISRSLYQALVQATIIERTKERDRADKAWNQKNGSMENIIGHSEYVPLTEREISPGNESHNFESGERKQDSHKITFDDYLRNNLNK